MPRLHSFVPSLRRRGLALTGGLAALFGAGCQTYQQQSADFVHSTQSGSIAAAVAAVDRKAESAKGTRDELVWRLEQGLSLRTAALADPALVGPVPVVPPATGAAEPATPPGPPNPDEVHAFYFKRSVTAFDLAEAVVDNYDQQAKVKVGAEVGATLTNLAALPYRGRAYDRVMMNTYQALNYAQLGRRDDVRLHLNRALQRQRDAVAENEKRIVEAQELATKAKNGEAQTADGAAAYDTGKAAADPHTGPALQAALDASTARMKPYGDYVNPFSVFMDGLFFSTLGENGADWERARKSIERVAQIVPENAYLKQDLEMAAAVAEGKAPDGLTYVFFETGLAPNRAEVRIDVPTFLVTSKLAYVGAAFPKLEFHDEYVASLAVSAGAQSYPTATLASMDSIVANDFKNEWPTIVTRTLLTTATKAIVQAAAQKKIEDNGGGAFGTLLTAALAITNMATTIADTRTWTSLPKEFQYARLATPADRHLTLTAGAVKQDITLVPGSINVVYVKSTAPSAPLLVSQFALK